MDPSPPRPTCSSSDARHCYDTLHGFKMDGRKWEVSYATDKDFKAGWREAGSVIARMHHKTGPSLQFFNYRWPTPERQDSRHGEGNKESMR